MKYLPYILFIICLNSQAQRLAHDLYCVVPVNASNLDVATELWCTPAWDTISSISYQLVTDTSGAFGITADTLYIADNTKLHASKTHQVVFKVTDGGYSETASAYIYGAPADSTVNQYTVSYNDNTFVTHYYYFYWRDTTYASHPEITVNVNDVFIGARGRGVKPKIVTGANSYAFNTDDHDSTILENLNIMGSAHEGVFIENAHRVKIRGCYLHGLGTDNDYMCIRTTNSNDSATIPNYLEIKDNWFDSIGSESFYGRSWFIEIAYNKMTNNGIFAAGGGDAIQLNCFGYHFWVHDNYINRVNIKTKKGMFANTHNIDVGGGCGIAGYDACGGVFEYNRCLGKDSMIFGTTTSGDADTFRFNYLEMTGVPSTLVGPDAGLKFDGSGCMSNNNILVGFTRGVFTPSQSNTFYNNTFHDVNYGIHSTDNNTNIVTLKNNIFSKNNNYAIYVHANVDVVSDYNLFDTCRFYDGSTYTTLGDWTTASGQDGNSQDAEPYFSLNYMPSDSSEAVDNGTNLSLTRDYYRRIIPNGTAQDIGAVERIQNKLPGGKYIKDKNGNKYGIK